MKQAPHLVVLVHGLAGTARDLTAVAAAIDAGDDEAVPLLISVNEGRTRDGVTAGGRRVTSEVRAFLARNPHISMISIIGNSLGGLYARECAYNLHCDDFLGLVPRTFATIAAPHLGVRDLAWVPGPFQRASPAVLGATGRDLFLLSDTLHAMTQQGYIDALCRFPKRILVANTCKDIVVPFSTAAIDHSCYPAGSLEHDMGMVLRKVGWDTMTVTLQSSPLPLAHNMACALSRDPVSERIYAGGLPVVRRLVEKVIGGDPAGALGQKPGVSASLVPDEDATDGIAISDRIYL